MLGAFVCHLTKHRVNRRKVWNDGISFRTRCRRCGRELLRGSHGWREFDPDRDGNPGRNLHPLGH